MKFKVRENSVLIPTMRQLEGRRAHKRVPDADACYVLSRPRGSQPRFGGRLALVPEADVDAYDYRSVIDFLKLEVTTAKAMAPKNLRAHLEAKGAPIGWVDPAPRPGESRARATRFVVMVNEPTPAKLKQTLEVMAALDTVDAYGRLMALEVSIDIYPKDREDETARMMMTDLLRRHAFPRESVWRRPDGWPRWEGLKEGETRSNESKQFLIGKTETELMQHLECGSFEARVPAPSNATTYFGSRDAPVAMVRIMDKVIDNQDPEAERREDLERRDCRSRIEVRLLGKALIDFMGEPHVDRLGQVDFQKRRST